MRSFTAKNTSVVADNVNSISQFSNDANNKTSTNNDSTTDDQNERHDDTLAIPTAETGEEVDVAGVSNIHFHLTVPRYYSPYEEVPFLYFINSSTPTYINQEKHYFHLMFY